MSSDKELEVKLQGIANGDVKSLLKARQSYGDSWKKRGGVGAFMMLARKWDRLEKQVERFGWDAFVAIEQDQRAEGIMDDIRDLRRYLMLVESQFEVAELKKDASVGVTIAPVEVVIGLNDPSVVKPVVLKSECGCGFIHAPGERCGPW